jgi:amidase
MSDLWELGAVELAAVMRGREASSRDVVEAHLARIDAVNPALNAVVRRLDEEALVAADAADKALASGDDVGPLHGVPCTVKENIDVAGTPTTHGIAALAEAIADRDSPVVARVRAAGAIPIARTNLPDLGLRLHTDSSLHGLTRNPWNPDVTAGGSSGGEGSALASGMSPLGLGNDMGGSLRNPAHCCGIASIKPTVGVVPHATVIPPVDVMLACQLMMAEGVMARRVADFVAGLRVVAGADNRDPISLPVALPEPPARPLRIAVLAEPPGGTTDPAIAGTIRAAASVLADTGHEVTEATPPSYEQTVVQWAALLAPDLQSQRPLLEAVMGADAMRFLELTDVGFSAFDTSGWPALFLDRYRIAAEWEQFFAEFDVLLSPTWTTPPFAHGADIASIESALEVVAALRPVLPANYLGLPAAVAPAAIVDGLPVGAQFTAARFGDLTALAAAAALEAVVGTFTPIEPRSRPRLTS